MGQLRLSDSDLLKELSAGELLEVQLNPSFELEGSVDSEDERTFEAAAPSAEPTLQAALTPSKLLSTAAKAAKSPSAGPGPVAPVSLLDKLAVQAKQISELRASLGALRQELSELRLRVGDGAAQAARLETGLAEECEASRSECQLCKGVLQDLLRITERLSEGLGFRKHVLLEQRIEELEAKLAGEAPKPRAPEEVALLHAACAGDVPALEQALERGAAADSGKPLLYAAGFGRLEALQRLLAEKVPLDLADPRGRTALHRCAARMGVPDGEQAKLVNKLLKAKADVTIVDEEGLSALDLAMLHGQRMVASLLREAGAPESDTTPPFCL